MEKVSDIMTPRAKVVTVLPDTLLTEAVISLSQHAFNGLPVVNENNKLVGMFSERALLTDQSYVHLSTLLKLFSGMEYYKKDHSAIKNQLKNIVDLKVKDVMIQSPPVIHPQSSIEEALQLFYNPANNPITVVDENNVIQGILSMSDFTKFYGVPMKRAFQEKDVNRKIDGFVEQFEKQFVIVSRFQISMWAISSILFALVGFIIAMFFIVKISLRT